MIGTLIYMIKQKRGNYCHDPDHPPHIPKGGGRVYGDHIVELKVIADKLRAHLDDGHRHGCGSRCECGYDAETGRLLRIAIHRLDEMEAVVRGWRERRAIDREDDPLL